MKMCAIGCEKPLNGHEKRENIGGCASGRGKTVWPWNYSFVDESGMDTKKVIECTPSRSYIDELRGQF